MLKSLTITAFVLLAMGTALAPVLSALYIEAYPDDPAKRGALATCAGSEREFNRLIAADRAACYGRHLHPLPARTGAPPAGDPSRSPRIA
jgi:hypothetical protein